MPTGEKHDSLEGQRKQLLDHMLLTAESRNKLLVNKLMAVTFLLAEPSS